MYNSEQIDWTSIMQRINQFFRNKLRNMAADAEDLTQETMEILWCKVEEGLVEDPLKFAYGIAKNRLMDYYRRLESVRGKRDLELKEGLDHEASNARNEFEALCSSADRAERLAFTLRAAFQRLHSDKGRDGLKRCARLAELILERVSLKEIAELAEFAATGYAALRQEWSRCLREFKASFRGDLDDLLLQH